MEPLNNPASNQSQSFADRWSGLRARAISGAAMAGVALATLWVGGWFFIAVVVAAALQMLREWDMLTAEENNRWHIAGVAYAAIPCACMIWLRQTGGSPVLYIILVVCATDIGAYFMGREIGGPKLAPTLSPNKTWAGLGGGMIAAALVSTICTSFAPYPASAPVAFVLGGLLAVVAQAGDLFESWLKRRAGVKDSGNLIPGHGGLLDRVDGLVAALPLYTLMFWVASLFS